MKVHIGPHRNNRKVKVQIDDYDLWNADQTLALIIVPLLIRLKEEKQGIPFVDPIDAPHIGRGNPCEYGYSDDLSEQRWQWALDSMIWSFTQIVEGDDYTQYYDPYQPDEYVQSMYSTIIHSGGKVKKRSLLSEQQVREMGKFNQHKADAYHNRIQVGLILFGKYFRALWS